MAVEIETTSFVMIPLDKIVSKLPVRRLSALGIKKLVESMKWAGFLENYPLIVSLMEDGTYLLIDGNHRYEAAKELDISLVPCVIKANLSELDRYKLAIQANTATESATYHNLVTNAEFIWARLAEVDERDLDKPVEKQRKKYTQSQVGEMLGWGRDKVTKYADLQSICPEAWNVIVTTFEKTGTSDENEVVTIDVTTSAFTERLLRSILDLTSDQQTELVTSLATNSNFSKGKFKNLAENYHGRNQAYIYALQKLGALDTEISNAKIKEVLEDTEDKIAKDFLGADSALELKEAIYSGAYDTDWTQERHPKLQKLLDTIREAWERKNSIRIIHGDFYEEVTKIADGSIDLILTDPPFNIATEREFNLEGRNNRSQDFGEWDKHEAETEFRSLFFTWATEWKRILRDQGSGYVFCSYRYVSYLHDVLVEAGLNVKGMVTWYKTNPGPQIEHVTFRNSCEHILFFIKGKSGHTFNWQGENEMHDHISTPICSGKERLVDAKGEVLHPTQKPISVLKHLMEISSNRGDTVFDGFSGVGSTGAVAKELKRKFIGIEKDDTYFAAMQRRLA